MAWVRRMKGKPNWIAGFSHAPGKSTQRTTGVRAIQKNKAKALQVARRLEAAAKKPKPGTYYRAKAFASVLDIFPNSHGSDGIPPGVVEFSGPWCPWEKESALRDIDALKQRGRQVHLLYTRKSITICHYAQRAPEPPKEINPWEGH